MQTAPKIIDLQALAKDLQHSNATWGSLTDEQHKEYDAKARVYNSIAYAERKYQRAKTYLIQHHAFYGSFLCNLEVGWTLDTALACTNGEILLMNPLTVDKELNKFELRYLLIHEVGHIAHMHPFRLKERDPQLWNIACDYTLNDLINKETDMSMHESGIWEAKYSNMAPEQIYPFLLDEIEKEEKNKDNAPGGGQSQCSNCGNPTPNDEQGQAQQCPNCGQKQQDQNVEKTKGEDEESGGAKAGDEEGTKERFISLRKDWLHGDIIAPPDNITTAEKKDLEAKIRRLCTEAAFHARSMGQDVQMANRVIDSITPKESWQLSLQSFVEIASDKDDYTWSRPRRRYVPFDIYVPDMGGNKPPRSLAVVIDVSGSINDEMLTEFLEELSSLICANPNVTYLLYQVDTRIVDYREIGVEDIPLDFSIRAGGGTSFVPAFKDIEDRGREVSGLIYFTDMESGKYPKEEPPYPVMWLNWGSFVYGPDGKVKDRNDFWYGAYDCPFGQVINMRS
jgi:predicted metal-dependent peptidase